MLIAQIVITLIGLYIIRIYLPPLVSLGELNLGNLFGYIAGGGIVLFGIFLNAIVNFVKSEINGDHKKQIITIIAVICTLAVMFLTAFFGTLGSIVSASHQTATDQTTVIVLGCRIRGDIPSGSLRARCSAAAKYLEAHPDAVVIASGGQGKDENLSEGQCIHDLLVEKGIDDSRIYIEDKSHSTDENVANSKKIIEENNLSKDVAIATSDYHEKRAGIICKKNGLNAYSIPANSTKWAKPTQFTREVFGVWAQLF
ncbi:MAG: YdcF family protein [Eubacterium sp.]|nr:YdcF family protein [Eubacterium sp.]